jgi:lycopene beta-cyclase
MKHYNYIFTGAGLSALMTVYKMALSGKFKDKTILFDERFKKTNEDLVFLERTGLHLGKINLKMGSALLPMLIFRV